MGNWDKSPSTKYTPQKNIIKTDMGNQSHGGLVQMIFSKSGVYQIPAVSFQGKYRVLFPTTSHLAYTLLAPTLRATKYRWLMTHDRK